MYLTPEKEALEKRINAAHLAADTVTFLRRRRFFNRAEALDIVLKDLYEVSRTLQNEALLIGEKYNSADYVIETEQNGETQNFVIRRRKQT